MLAYHLKEEKYLKELAQVHKNEGILRNKN